MLYQNFARRKIIGGLFALSNDHHLSQLAASGLAIAEQEGEAFTRAFRDVFWLGAIVSIAGAGVFLLSGRAKPTTAI